MCMNYAEYFALIYWLYNFSINSNYKYVTVNLEWPTWKFQNGNCEGRYMTSFKLLRREKTLFKLFFLFFISDFSA